MKQLLQNARTGEIAVAEVPAPQLLPGCALVRIRASVVSAGTERAASEFARKSLLDKARSRPDLVREVLNKVRRDGVFPTLGAVQSRLDQPLAVGYSSSGEVIAVAEDVTDIAVGDAVACAGAGYAVHAEFACVPRLLLAKISDPSAVSWDHAAFGTLGAVALHGVRVAEVRLGDLVGVIGLGLIGQLTVQILKSAGCRVLGYDLDPVRAELAVSLGADDAVADVNQFRELALHRSGGAGLDSILITAETPSSEPVQLAGAVARDRAIVVAIGTVGMDIQRKAYFEKELDFRVSRSYGPGRYDSVFEQKGRDYPIGYVRWTETRNLAAFLDLLAEGKVRVAPMITHRFPIENARQAYDLVTGTRREPSLGIVLTYPESEAPLTRVIASSAASPAGSVRLGVLGAGSFAVNTLLPAIKGIAGLEFAGVCAATGAHARHAADKFSFRFCTSDENEILGDDSINAVLIATRHHLHARQVKAALAAGKHVFCEKPLCLTQIELAEIGHALRAQPKTILAVGFNRRFAPLARQLKEFVASSREPLLMHYRVNAGYIAPDHWIQDHEQGGGRLLGEVCHFVDFLTFLAGAEPVEVTTQSLGNAGRYSGDNFTLLIRFANGSQGSVLYAANGDRASSKERVEVFCGGAMAVLEDFRRLELVRGGRRRVTRSRTQDKGHRAEWEAFVATLRRGGPAAIAFEDIAASTLATLCAQDSLRSGVPVPVKTREFLAAALSDALASSHNENHS